MGSTRSSSRVLHTTKQTCALSKTQKAQAGCFSIQALFKGHASRPLNQDAFRFLGESHGVCTGIGQIQEFKSSVQCGVVQVHDLTARTSSTRRVALCNPSTPRRDRVGEQTKGHSRIVAVASLRNDSFKPRRALRAHERTWRRLNPPNPLPAPQPCASKLVVSPSKMNTPSSSLPCCWCPMLYL